MTETNEQVVQRSHAQVMKTGAHTSHKLIQEGRPSAFDAASTGHRQMSTAALQEAYGSGKGSVMALSGSEVNKANTNE